MKISSIAVFCGSKNGANPLYEQHARETGVILAKHNIALIYGGGSKGLMGSLANSMLQYNGKVIGIIPTLLVEWEHQHDGITELTVVENMHERKKRIYELCDAALVLPGGYGTMDELFEMVTWNQLSIHDKRIFLLNSGGFYNSLIDHLILAEQQGFLYGNFRKSITVIDHPVQFIEYLS